MIEIGLVSSTKSKREQASRPAELYMESAFFQNARAYVESNHDRWYILSAKHGLLDPDGPLIDHYEETLSGAPIDRKRGWSERVFDQLQDEGILIAIHRLVFHAGRFVTDLRKK